MGGLFDSADFPWIADEHSREHPKRKGENQKGFRDGYRAHHASSNYRRGLGATALKAATALSAAKTEAKTARSTDQATLAQNSDRAASKRRLPPVLASISAHEVAAALTARLNSMLCATTRCGFSCP